MKQIFWDLVPAGRLVGTFWVEDKNKEPVAAKPLADPNTPALAHATDPNHPPPNVDEGNKGGEEIQLDFSALEENFAQVIQRFGCWGSWCGFPSSSQGLPSQPAHC